jgi:hypothetical protein
MADIAKGGEGLIAALAALARCGTAVFILIQMRQVGAELEIWIIGLLSPRCKTCADKPDGGEKS